MILAGGKRSVGSVACVCARKAIAEGPELRKRDYFRFWLSARASDTADSMNDLELRFNCFRCLLNFLSGLVTPLALHLSPLGEDLIDALVNRP